MNSDPLHQDSSIEPTQGCSAFFEFPVKGFQDFERATGHKLYLNRREKLEQKHETELARCRLSFDEFLEKYRNPNANNLNFNKVLEVVKVPFTGLPSLGQIRAFYQNYISR